MAQNHIYYFHSSLDHERLLNLQYIVKKEMTTKQTIVGQGTVAGVALELFKCSGQKVGMVRVWSLYGQ